MINIALSYISTKLTIALSNVLLASTWTRITRQRHPVTLDMNFETVHRRPTATLNSSTKLDRNSHLV